MTDSRSLEPAIDTVDYEASISDVSLRVIEIHNSVSPASLPQWVVYGNETAQHPGFFAARLWIGLPEVTPTNAVLRAGTLHEIRALLPPGLVCIPRSRHDDADIVETWM